MMYEALFGFAVIFGIFGVMAFLADYVIPGDFFEGDDPCGR